VGSAAAQHGTWHGVPVSTPPYLRLPEGVETVRLGTGTAALRARASGRAGAAADPLILVPGWTGSKEDFIAVVAPLAATGRDCVAVDLRGQYESAGPDDPDAYSLADYAADVVSVADSLGARQVHLLGHSLGGLVAQSVVADHPRLVRSLTLLCSGPGALPADRHDLLRLMADAIVEHGLPTTYQAKRAFDRQKGIDLHVPADVEQWLEQRFVSHHPQSLRAMTLHLTEAEERVAEVAATGVPVLVAFGDQDDGWPLGVQRELAERLAARLHVFAGAGHSPAVERPDELAAVVGAFLAAVEAGPTSPGRDTDETTGAGATGP
jgi:pimeloyl-ACP methyl ester carboxylesterase